MALQIPATAGFVGVDTTSAKTIQLPLASQKPGRVLTIKDRTGGAALYPITIQTQGSDSFEDGTTSYVINTAYGSVQFIARATKWLRMIITVPDPTSTLALSTGAITMSSIRGDGSQLFNLPAVSTLSLNSTLQGLGSAGYISTQQLQSTVASITSNISSMIDPVELASSIVGLGTIGFTSSIGLTFILNSTVTGLSSNISSMIDPVELASTITGLGSVGFISSVGLDAKFGSTLVGLGTAGYASTIYVQQTSNFARGILQDFSTGLSTVALFTSNTSNYDRNYLQNTSTWISTVALFTSNTALSVSSLHGVVSSGLSSVALFTSNTSNYARGFLQDYSTAVSSVAQFTSNTSNYSRGFLQDYSTAVSSVALFTSNTSNYARGFLQDYSTAVSSVAQFTSNTSNYSRGFLQDYSTAVSSVALFTSNTSNYARGFLQDYSTAVSTVAQFTSNTSNYSRGFLQDYSTAVSSVAFFTSNTSNYARGFLQDYSTAVSTVAQFTSNTSNYARGFLQDYSTAVSSVALFTSNTSNYARGFLQDFSTGLSTVALFTSNTSNYSRNFLQNTSTWISTVALFTSNTALSVSSLHGVVSSGLSSVALFTSNSSNYSQNLLQNTSTWISTVALFTSNTSLGVSSLYGVTSSGLSSVALFTSNSSNYSQNLLQNTSTWISTVALFTSNTALGVSSLHGVVSSGLSTVALFTSNTALGVSSLHGAVSSGLSTVALFTSNTALGVSSLHGVVSSGLSTVALFTSNTALGVSSLYGIVSSGLSTVALFTSNTSNFFQNLTLYNVSTAITSTTTSTLIGLGTIGYISSFSTLNISSGNVFLSSLTLMDGVNTSRNYLTVSSGILRFNGTALNATAGTFSNFTLGRITTDQPISTNADYNVLFVADNDPQGWIKNAGTNSMRFLPSIAGYYFMNYQVWWATATGTNQFNMQMRKNGNSFTITQNQVTTAVGLSQNASKLVYLNGSTDYVDFTVFQGTGANINLQSAGAGIGTFFSAYLIPVGSGGGSGEVTSIVAGSNINVSPSDGKGVVTVSVAGLPAFAPTYSQTLGSKVNVPLSASLPFTVVSTTVTTSGNPVFVICSGDIENATAGAWCRFQLYRGSTTIGNSSWTEHSAGSENNPFSISAIDAPAAGTYTYSLRVIAISGGAFNFGEVDGPVLSATEMAGGGGILPLGLTSTIQGLGTFGYASTTYVTGQISSFSTSLGRVAMGSSGLASLPSTISTFSLLTSSIQASTIQSILLSSQSLFVSSLYTATSQATPMFITF